MPVSSPEGHQPTPKRRAGKACDLCRIRKTRCDGGHPCSRCVADNKICAFSKKKKSIGKPHPNGYLELLETRVDVLTESLRKLVDLAEPHLPFIQQIKEKAKLEHSQITTPDSEESLLPVVPIPINEIISYLTSNVITNNGKPAPNVYKAEKNAEPKTKSVKMEFPRNTRARLRKNSLKREEEDVDTKDETSAEIADSEGLEEVVPKLVPNSVGQSVLEYRLLFQKHDHSPPSRTSSTHLLFIDSNDTGFSENFNSHQRRTDDIFTGSRDLLHSPLLIETLPFDLLDQNFLRLNLIFRSTGGTISTSPLSISSLPAKFENQCLEEASNFKVAHANTVKDIRSGSFSRRKGSIHKPQVSPHSHIMPASRLNNPKIKQDSEYQDTCPLQQCVHTTEFDFENDLLFNEPPSKMISEDIPCGLENEEIPVDLLFSSYGLI